MVRAKGQDILSWFDISRYDRLLDMTIEDFIDDVQLRAFLLYLGNDKDEKMTCSDMHESRLSFIEGLKKGHVWANSAYLHSIGEGDYKDNELPDEEILRDLTVTCNGYPIISRGYFEQNEECNYTDGVACTSFNVGDLISYYKALTRHEYVVEKNKGVVEVQGTSTFTPIVNVDYLGESFGGEIVIKLNLEEYSNEELITEFKELIKHWRSESGIDEPDRTNNRMGFSSLKKLITYKIIPFIDLLIWEMAYNKKISNEMFARVLFPLTDFDSEIMSGVQIKDTIKPFIEKILHGDLLREVLFFLKKNEYLKDMRFSDVLKLAEN
ncbi:DUF6387 family protein [Xenorhabdus bovienii]|uniref:DUF6387 family protein n=1 Tax=Xenorhabdus bovienii TaxID=40576 RepID=UPI00237CDF21|nr:DUF6387 family protein [Xenorhabdus bovienii]MDE1482700.1 DUF6387 family protein [Xenorhabdus bovienii]MDE9441140.1 DUF6387 family protein [Xenorhabdus bovienii]MDE9546586.1 DUF6387 family protein [Xenorhabdus bovienii]